ncbi:MAG: AAA family ATPase [Solirubrobacteraceae bacterium]
MGVPKTFPLEAPIRPEARQIGRKAHIDALESQVVNTEQHTLLFADRHVGKTSMAWAVLDRIRTSEAGWALEVNLSHGPVRSSASLAARLAEQARTAHLRIEPIKDGIWRRGRAAARIAPATAAAASALGVDIEGVDLPALATAVDGALAGSEDEDTMNLREVLSAIQVASISADRPTIVFVDEVQRLSTSWGSDEDGRDAQLAIAETMDHAEGRVVFLLAGSERSAVEELLAEGQPLRREGMMFEVQPISGEDWRHGLADRFSELNAEITSERIDQILRASAGHPQRTMRVCAHVQQIIGSGMFDVSELVVEQAIERAQGHPSWSD